MQYHDKDRLSVLEIPKDQLPWYHKLWAYPLGWVLNGIARLVGVK